MNENLRRALIRAQLSEEDVAARLQVDPKTVRRWLEGRVPYLRHRWAIAGMVGLDEADIWPQVGAARSRPEEIVAVYPHRDDVPRQLWRSLFSSAETEISILDAGELFLVEDPGILATLESRSEAGARVRVCLRDPEEPKLAVHPTVGVTANTPTARIRDTLDGCEHLRERGVVEFRLHPGALNNSIYRFDNDIMVAHRAYGIPDGRAPVLHLRQAGTADMVAIYLESLERAWDSARTTSK